MDEQQIIDITVQTLWVAIKVASPVLFSTLLMGILVSIFQAATQINEQTMSFIPKVLAMTITLVITGPWLMKVLMNFTVDIFNLVQEVNR